MSWPQPARPDRDAFVVAAVACLRRRGVTVTKIALQKMLFAVEVLFAAPFDFGFALHKHGPYSFALKAIVDDLAEEGVLRVTEDRGLPVIDLVGHTPDREVERCAQGWLGHLDFVADMVAGADFRDLERLGTALLCVRDAPFATPEQHVVQLHALKPHIPIRAARAGVEQVRHLQADAAAQGLADPRRNLNRTPSTARETSVYVSYGRNLRLRDAMFAFLRCIGLEPMDWEDVIAVTHSGSAYTGEAVSSTIRTAYTLLALLTPDEDVALDPRLATGEPQDKDGAPVHWVVNVIAAGRL